MRNRLTAPLHHPDGSNFLWTTSFAIRDKQQGVEKNYRKKKKRSNGKHMGEKRRTWHKWLLAKLRQLSNQQVEIQVPLNSSDVQGSASKLREFWEISRYIFFLSLRLPTQSWGDDWYTQEGTRGSFLSAMFCCHRRLLSRVQLGFNWQLFDTWMCKCAHRQEPLVIFLSNCMTQKGQKGQTAHTHTHTRTDTHSCFFLLDKQLDGCLGWSGD